MATLQASGAIAISNIKSLFGGPTSPSLSNYYRGGSYIPSTKTVSTMVYEPPNGNSFLGVTPKLTAGYWWIGGLYQAVWFTFNSKTLWWDGVIIASNIDTGVTSIVIGSYTYYRGGDTAYEHFNTSGYYWEYGFYVRRTSGGSSTVSINTGIPSGGTIKLSQFYGAEQP
jgi:hypothetical protein